MTCHKSPSLVGLLRTESPSCFPSEREPASAAPSDLSAPRRFRVPQSSCHPTHAGSGFLLSRSLLAQPGLAGLSFLQALSCGYSPSPQFQKSSTNLSSGLVASTKQGGHSGTCNKGVVTTDKTNLLKPCTMRVPLWMDWMGWMDGSGRVGWMEPLDLPWFSHECCISCLNRGGC